MITQEVAPRFRSGLRSVDLNGGRPSSPWLLEGIGQWCYPEGVSDIHRLRLTDRIFFVNVNLRAKIRRFSDSEYALIIDVVGASRRRLGLLLWR